MIHVQEGTGALALSLASKRQIEKIHLRTEDNTLRDRSQNMIFTYNKKWV